MRLPLGKPGEGDIHEDIVVRTKADAPVPEPCALAPMPSGVVSGSLRVLKALQLAHLRPLPKLRHALGFASGLRVRCRLLKCQLPTRYEKLSPGVRTWSTS